MSESSVPHPPIVSSEAWLEARIKLLQKEKELTKQRDQINAERRRLPMVRIEKPYVFEGPKGKVSLKDLFDGQRQLIIYHFMFDPEWEDGCPGCTGFVDAIGSLETLGERHTAFTLVSRAPFEKLEKYKKKRNWAVSWFSSYGSDFNYDFHVTHDESMSPIEYNFKNRAELDAQRGDAGPLNGEAPGLSVFFRIDDDVYHTYSTYARGVEDLTDSYNLLDVTPYG